MLPTVGYFRSIDCPSIIENGICQRPYCHFRHSNLSSTTSYNPSKVKINLKEKADVSVKRPSFSTDVKHELDANHKSVLHGARGAAISARKSTKSVRKSHSQSTSSKPLTDLEYDPMCNYDLGGKKTRTDDVEEKNSSCETTLPFIDLTEDDATDDESVDDCGSSDAEERSLLANIANDKPPPKKITNSPESSSDKQRGSTKENQTAIVISDSDSENSEQLNSSTDKGDDTCVPSQKLNEKKHNSSSSNENAMSKRETIASKMKPNKKNDKVVKIKSKLSKKSVSVKTSHENKLKRTLSTSKEVDTPKRKKLKTKVLTDSSSDIEKYVSKDEIEKLDRELKDGGIYECYRIYQEASFSNNVAKEPAPVIKKKVEKENVNEAEPSEFVVLQKSRRIARTSASQSAHNLNRERKLTKRLLTPQQAMMKRMEVIQKEQEQRLLSSVAKHAASHNNVTSSKRQAHSSFPVKSSSSSSEPNRPSSVKKTKPFENLLSRKSSGTFQGTLVKGHLRSAHVPFQSVDDVIEKPRIAPDRHSKVPTNIRQRFLNSFIDECLRIHKKNRLEAFNAAKLEEKQCNERSKSKGIYLSLAASTLKKLRATVPGQKKKSTQKSPQKSSDQVRIQNTAAVTVPFKSNSVRIAHGTTPRRAALIKSNSLPNTVKRQASHHERVASKSRLCKGGFSILQKEAESTPVGEELYETLCRYLMAEQELADNGFPRPADISGRCKFMVDKPKPNPDKSKKTCARCGKEFVLYREGHFPVEDECIHHWGKAFSTKVGSHWEKRYNCCQTPIGTEGCSVGETHVHKDNVYDCNSYVQTLKKTEENRNPGVYALDCEMAFTVNGLELIRVSVVNFNCQLVYDSLVKPKGKILDYNTRWSGLDEKDLKGVTTSLRDVQAVLLNKFSSDTILIGHSLESDLVALRIIHSSVIDTSLVFPHRLGPPHKRALRNLMSENLGIIIQNAVDEGHDSMEDASACIKLMKWKLKEDLKLHH